MTVRIAFLSITFTAAAVLLALPSKAHAGDGCDIYDVGHNGSRMTVENCGGSVVIYYTRPKGSLRKHGVRNGTTLVSGSISGGRLRGTAYRFKRGCGAIGYRVSGRYSPDGFTLTGTAPLRGSGCTITRNKRDRLGFY